jgi:hypothetical protein
MNDHLGLRSGVIEIAYFDAGLDKNVVGPVFMHARGIASQHRV